MCLKEGVELFLHNKVFPMTIRLSDRNWISILIGLFLLETMFIGLTYDYHD